jgi:hypothetical protein
LPLFPVQLKGKAALRSVKGGVILRVTSSLLKCEAAAAAFLIHQRRIARFLLDFHFNAGKYCT